ncbi:phosphate signaling complex protein PhoU [Aneurinibacillus thermoaerophilus]|uniref:Phosphate-specific transport system accessory protein PhoU n=1 Tax=Aneurinibacillus thermoaerophilus TaxID=143495 RepID=A0ABX8YCC1_ANETH|nr:phosphate signaling complex protein PhoU [Aneurinibacillus thermoaerophilus]MED0675980.1 phosphate signaling complex protein PhoU [Aneurinibacillus thermoaerophilus]MED0738707.1 phosphate signaling complex protein PhoU [Aneurinibacillus thermoaerophilus]QYY42964.1 phosphate signaling complex protein PhoU [Aneurinibacillus thermoaerophilus]
MQEGQLEQLKNEITQMALIAQAGFFQAWSAFQEVDLKLAKDVIVRDEKLNVLAEKIFKMSLSLIALQAPVATDLRTIGSYLKIATDLERIGDHAVKIAKVVVRLNGKKSSLSPKEIPIMGEKVAEMLEVCVQAIQSGDARHLRLLDNMDDGVDEYYKKCFDYIEWSMEKRPDLVKEGVQLIKVIQSLERIGDHATNIGEWTLYMCTGSIADLNT